MSKKESTVPTIRHCYRVPLRSVYNKNRIDQTKSWNDVYGKCRCEKCRKHFQEGEAYETTTTGKYQHVECPKK